MSRERWIFFMRVACVAGLAIFAAGTVASTPGTATETFFNSWFYNALMVFACVVVGARE
mgnify:FL=1